MAYRTILLKGDFTLGRNEFKAAGADIYPGMCLKLNTDGDVATNNAQGYAEQGMIIALEDDLQGNEVGTIYSDDNQVQCYFARPGDILALRIEQSEAIAIGDKITCQNDGNFEEAVSGDYVVAIALEASSTGTADTLVKCIIVDCNQTI